VQLSFINSTDEAHDRTDSNATESEDHPEDDSGLLWCLEVISLTFSQVSTTLNASTTTFFQLRNSLPCDNKDGGDS